MLLEILCVLLKGRRTVSFPDGSFVQGSTVFAAHGYAVRTRYKDADIIYVSPSHMNRQGDVMPIQRRLELCAHSADTGAVVIEDDFENDFLYSSTPPLTVRPGQRQCGVYGRLLRPAAAGHSHQLYGAQPGAGRRLPSNERHLCPNCVQDGADCPVRLPAGREYEVPHKKIRRLYTGKAKTLCALLAKALPDHPVRVGENGLQVQIENADATGQRPF